MKKRAWGDLRDVDSGLPDNWLDRVNSLCYWQVGSTCEGHTPPVLSTESDHARIFLNVRERYLEAALQALQNSTDRFTELVLACFSGNETRYSLVGEAEGNTIAIPSEESGKADRRECDREDMLEECLTKVLEEPRCVLNLHHVEIRQGDLPPPSVLRWLDDICNQLERFDKECAKLIEGH